MPHISKKHKKADSHQSSPSQKQSPKTDSLELNPSEVVEMNQENWTEQDILQLQRVVGNRQVQRILNRKADSGKSNLIQRAETGMRRSSLLNRYSKDALAIMTDHPDMAPNEFVTKIHKLAGTELKATGAPETNLAFGGSGAGSFNRGTWTIEVNTADVFGTAVTVGAANQASVDDLINTMYHETRHAEQVFRTLRMRAGKIIPEGTQNPDYAATATQINADTGVTDAVTLAAAKNPLYASWGAKFLGAKDKMMEEAEAWDKNFSGANVEYDWLMQSGFDDVTKPLMDAAQALSPHLGDVLNWGTLDVATQDDIDDKFDDFTDAVTDLDTLMAGDAQVELDRLNAIDAGDRSTNDTLMLNYMTEIFRLYGLIQTRYGEYNAAEAITDWNTVFDKVDDINDLTDDLDDQVMAAYKDLPEEKDAFAAGDTAERKLNEERAKVGP